MDDSVNELIDWAMENDLSEHRYVEGGGYHQLQSHWEGLPRNTESLKSLTELVLRIHNRDCSPIPESIYSLNKLKKLELYSFHERIPSNIDRLGDLEELVLFITFLKKLPPKIVKLSSLKRLSIQGDITKLPDDFGELSNLEELHLDMCLQLKSLPKSIICIRGLKVLSLPITNGGPFKLSLAQKVWLKRLNGNGCVIARCDSMTKFTFTQLLYRSLIMIFISLPIFILMKLNVIEKVERDK